MTEVIVSKQIKVQAEKAWGNLVSFRGIEHISPIEKSETTGEGEGAEERRLPRGAVVAVDGQAKDADLLDRWAHIRIHQWLRLPGHVLLLW